MRIRNTNFINKNRRDKSNDRDASNSEIANINNNRKIIGTQARTETPTTGMPQQQDVKSAKKGSQPQQGSHQLKECQLQNHSNDATIKGNPAAEEKMVAKKKICQHF
jgi:hypothetical protein